MRLTAAGIVLGWLAAAALTRLMRTVLFEVRPLEPLSFGVTALVLAAFAAGACYIPARRATRVDPVATLRSDA